MIFCLFVFFLSLFFSISLGRKSLRFLITLFFTYYSKIGSPRAQTGSLGHKLPKQFLATSNQSQPAFSQTVSGNILEAGTDQRPCSLSNLQAATLSQKVREFNHTDATVAPGQGMVPATFNLLASTYPQHLKWIKEKGGNLALDTQHILRTQNKTECYCVRYAEALTVYLSCLCVLNYEAYPRQIEERLRCHPSCCHQMTLDVSQEQLGGRLIFLTEEIIP